MSKQQSAEHFEKEAKQMAEHLIKNYFEVNAAIDRELEERKKHFIQKIKRMELKKVKTVTKYTAEDWHVMESSFAEYSYFLKIAELNGIPKGGEYEFLKSVRESFTIMTEIIKNLKGEQQNEHQ